MRYPTSAWRATIVTMRWCREVVAEAGGVSLFFPTTACSVQCFRQPDHGKTESLHVRRGWQRRCNRSARPWLPGCAEAANGHCGRKRCGSTLGPHPLVGRLHGVTEGIRPGNPSVTP